VIKLTTNHGVIMLDLNAEKAPKTVANFLAYVEAGHYDNTVFHRVIKNFMIQGGGMNPALHEIGPTYPPIKNESGNGLKNVPGAIAMARTSDPDSATDQFFIDTHDNAFLDRPPGYAVFGKVVSGMDIVRKIENAKTSAKPSADGVVLRDVPVENVVIKTIRIANK
jgi:peptidyl-prolyl cis-trans isomerase B (cyclophilin B)